MASTRKVLQTLACTPHFKDDAQDPWVTMESPLQVSYWFNPQSGVTLEDMAAAMESFASSNFSRQLQGAGGVPGPVSVNYSGQILNVAIRGQIYSRETLINYSAAEYLHDGEAFNMDYRETIQASLCCCILL